MAMERTFAGWMRTSFAAIGIGLGFHAVFGTFEPPGLARAIATLFIGAGALLAWSAQRRACKTLARLHPHTVETARSPDFRLLACAVIVGSVVLVAGIWILNEAPITPS